ncbi:uncharacterized protein B0P05DRAFT_522214 [Gilbertella persicaria]|uniref:Outer spore wall protein RRT8 n=1 Tax=Rhizopus stolonifer TaxID=4846 RepID=A0A367KSL1_RHIST|nr:uncharacterized protein B0P05DRAFT_522214 [Gilbertella persicaria]KAI8097822.1 hypothetical protein B0P05DRAFT_522214 [Gilbertella persicaria]RCI05194.1 hypothetical protein CU098_012215 [Rhizopus stolonifer]
MFASLRERRLPTATYPLRGLAHFLHHPSSSAGPIALSIVKVITASSLAIFPLYRYGYSFQKGLLAIAYKNLFLRGESPSYLSSLLITATSVLICLAETSAITLQLGEYFVGSVRTRVFDSVLRERKALPTGDVSAISEKVGGAAVDPAMPKYHFLSPYNLMIVSAQEDNDWPIFFLRSALFVLTLPLNAVPVIGPICFVNIQALFRGGQAHQRYFQLYKWTPVQRQRRIELHFWQYQRFGLVATLLEMIPFAGYLFIYTNQIGAAMWAMDLHDLKLLEPTSSKKD